MLHSLFSKTLRDERRGLMWWSIGLVAMAAWTLGWYRSFIGKIPDMSKFLDRAPSALKAFFGGNFDFTTPVAYLRTELFSFMAPLLLAIFAVGKGASAIAGEEAAGSLDGLLAAPISRRRVLIEKLAAVASSTILLSGGLAAALVVGIAVTGLKVDVLNAVAASLMAGLFAVVLGTIALAVGGATGRKGPGLGVAAAVGVGGYLLYGIAGSVDALRLWRWIFPFTYYAQADVLKNGVNVLHAGVLVIGTLVTAAMGVVLFERRDLRT